MLSKRNCRKSHFVLTFFNFLWFISIFSIFCGPQHREIEITCFLKTGYCPNYSRYKPSKYWKFSILTAIPTPKLGFHKNMIILFSLLSHGVLHYFVTNYHDLVTFWTNYQILKRFHYFVNFSHIVLRRTALQKLQKTCSCMIWWCCYLGRKH